MLNVEGRSQLEEQQDSSLSLNESRKPLNLLLLGDCMLGRLVNEALKNLPPEYPWGNTIQILHSADWRLCNLECVISDRGEPWSEYPKPFLFRSDAKNIAVLQTARMNAVTLANNHVLDYGYDALAEMLDILDRAGIVHSGAGLNDEQASRVATSEVHGCKLGILAFTDNEPDWEAGPSRPGVFYVPTNLNDWRAAKLMSIARENRGNVDLLIVSAHWGSNWGYRPPEEHVTFSHALIDAGADIVFGHSSHVFRGVEFYKRWPIVYSAGNFVDDYAVDRIERNDQSFIFLLEMAGRAPQSLHLCPTLIRTCHASLAKGVHALGIAEKMKELCAELHTRAVWNQVQGRLELGAFFRERAES